MKFKQKLIIFCVTIFSFVGAFLLINSQSNAASAFPFNNTDLNAVKDVTGHFFFKDDIKTIVGKIKSKDGATHDVIFKSQGPPPDPSQPYQTYRYVNQTDFCEPSWSSAGSQIGFSNVSNLSELFIKFTSDGKTSPIKAKVSIYGGNVLSTERSLLWPGYSNRIEPGPNGGSVSDCGVALNPTQRPPVQYSPVYMDSGDITLEQPLGPSAKYTKDAVNGASYSFVPGDGNGGGLIKMSFHEPSNNPAPVYFADSVPTDYSATGSNKLGYESASIFCDSNSTNPNKSDINLRPANPLNLGDSPMPAIINIHYWEGNLCVPASNQKISIENPPDTVGSDKVFAAQEIFQWNNGKIEALKCTVTADSSSGSCEASWSLSLLTGKDYIRNTSGCTNDEIVLSAVNGNTGTYTTSTSTAGGCVKSDPRNVAILGIATQPPGTGTCSDGIQNGDETGVDTGGRCSGGAATGGGSCAENSGSWALAWVACPLLTGAGDFTNNLLDGFEGLLSFTIPPNPTGNDGLAQVKQSWAIFRTLASTLLVIVLLVVVISQAIGGTFLDAYSVRKMLPRIVIAVIAMQLSWVLIVWIVGIVDDLGKGIADLMYQPFHGSNQMGLGALLDHANIGAYQQGAISWVGIIGLLVLGTAGLPVLMALLFTAALGLLVGFVTLILRKLVIIITLIFVPVALLLWVLPGTATQRLWKMWLDNFSKALLMFPLVVMLVAAGRILAYIAGTQGNGTFLNLLIIFVGFFGPLFVLPKAFKWGGSAMQFAGNMTTKAAKPIGEKGGGAIKGHFERWQGERAKRYDPLANRRQRTLRRIQSGHILPTERSRRLTIASGNKWADERNEEATALVTRTQEKALKGYDRYETDGDGNYLRYHKNADGEYLDAAGSNRDAAGNLITKENAYFDTLGKDKESKKQATHELLTGVAAGKQALIDIAGNDGKSVLGRQSVTAQRAAQAAVKQLIDTHSEIELQKSRIQGGKNQGRRASEVGMWRDAITNSPPHYGAINGSRPDLAPDLIESAVADAIKTGDVGAGTKYEEATAAERKVIDKHRMRITLERMTPEQLSNAHYGLFNDIAEVGAETVTYKDPVTGLGVTSTVAEQFENTLRRFQDSNTTIGRNAVGSLRGGKEIHVNKALGKASGPGGRALELDDIAPPGP